MSNPMPSPKRHSRGFTLLELLVSIALLGMVVGLVYSAFFQLSGATRGVQDTLSARQELRLLMKMVLDDLQAVRFLKHWAEAGGDEGRVSGLDVSQQLGPNNEDSSVVSLHAAVRAKFYKLDENGEIGDPELHEIGYFLEYDSDDQVWKFLRREDFYLDDEFTDGGKQQVLSRRVSKFLVEPRVAEKEAAFGGGSTDLWEPLWSARTHECVKKQSGCLPLAVRLTMGIALSEDESLEQTQQINLTVRPLNEELFK